MLKSKLRKTKTLALTGGLGQSDQALEEKYQVNFTMAEFGITETWPKVDLLTLYTPVKALVEDNDHFCSLRAEVLYFPEIKIPPVAIHPKYYTSDSYFAYENAGLLVPNLNVYKNHVYFVADPDFFSFKNANLSIADAFKAPLNCDELFEKFTELRNELLELRHKRKI